MSDTLDKVRAKIIEAVPEIVEFERCGCGMPRRHMHDVCPEGSRKVRPITLADVLRAIEKAPNEPYSDYFICPDGQFCSMDFGCTDGGFSSHETWNLSLPLDEQEPEVIEFIGKVLNV